MVDGVIVYTLRPNGKNFVSFPRLHPRGWADWNTFVSIAKPILELMCYQLDRSPRDDEVRQAGHQWLLSAARHHHGGYLAILGAFGMLRAPQTRHHRVARPLIVPRIPDWHDREVSGQRPYGFWSLRTHQIRALHEVAQAYLDWGTMPSPGVVYRVYPGLAMHWLRQPGAWKAAGQSFQLLPYAVGRRQKAIALAIIEALNAFEAHRRWPTKYECSNSLRLWRWSGMKSWEDFVGQTQFHPAIAGTLADRWRKHWVWSQHHSNEEHQQFALRVMNSALIVRNGTSPT